MKKKSLTFIVATVLAGSMTFSSCIGSFALFNKVLDWNRNFDSKWVNELVFLCFNIIPVYGVAMIVDYMVCNSIEFWSGNNPVADAGKVQTIETENGVFIVETKTDGYQISKEGEDTIVNLIFNEEDQSWNLNADGETTKLFEFIDNDKVVMFMPNGDEVVVDADQASMLALQKATR